MDDLELEYQIDRASEPKYVEIGSMSCQAINRKIDRKECDLGNGKSKKYPKILMKPPPKHGHGDYGLQYWLRNPKG